MREFRRVVTGGRRRSPDEFSRIVWRNQLRLLRRDEEDKCCLLDGLKPIHRAFVIRRIDLVEGRPGCSRCQVSIVRMHLLCRVMVVPEGPLVNVSKRRFDEAQQQS